MKIVKEFFIKYKKSILFYAVAFVCMLVLSRARLVSVLAPFGFSFAFALLALNKNGFIVSLSYFAANMILDPTFTGLIINICTFSSLLLCYLLFKIIRKPVPFYAAMIFAIISKAGFIYYNISSTEEIFKTIVSVITGVIFIYIFYISLKAILNRGFQSRFTADEKVCLCLLLVALFSGTSDLYIKSANFTVAIVGFLILLSSKVLPNNMTMYIAALAGVGAGFYSSSLVSMAVYVSFALISVSLADAKRIFSAILVLACDGLFGVFFGVYDSYNIFNILPLLVALIFYTFMPNKWLDYLKGFSFKYDGSLINEFLISGERENIKNRLLGISDLFKQMQTEYRNLSIGEVERQEAVNIMAEEIIASFCSGCTNKNVCKQNELIKQSLVKLFTLGVERGKVSMLDATTLLSGTCISLSALLSEVNSSLKMYFEYEKTIKSSDQGKLLAAMQLGGTAEIFKELAGVSLKSRSLNKKKARELLDELSYSKITASECVVLESMDGVKEVVLAIKNADCLSPELTKCLKNVFNISFSVKERKMSKLPGVSILSLVPSDKYKLSIGFASNSIDKKSVSGDTKGVVKISDSKYLFAISDGMGHGEKANNIATSALSLIENFYKAGLSSETIISSVNKIFLPSGEENFVTLDACIVDLSLGVCDFIKIGASVSVIKSSLESKAVWSESLPLGITAAVNPKVESRILKEGDIIVLASDGVVDSFAKVEDYVSFVNNENVISLQMFADTILEEAECRAVHKDDKTVITIKLNPCQV